MTIVLLANTFLVMHSHHFLFVMRACEVYSRSSCSVYDAVLLTLSTVLCIRSPELTHLTTGSSSHSPAPTPGHHHSTLYFYEVTFLRCHI